MKNLMLFMVILYMAEFTLAQDRVQDRDQARTRLQDHVMMKDGQMYLIRDQKQIQLQEQLRLNNGTLVNPDGTYLLKNGKKLRLKDGSCLDMDGNIYRSQAHMRDKLQKRDRIDQKKMDRNNNGRGSGRMQPKRQ